jgi:hypothetical protein
MLERLIIRLTEYLFVNQLRKADVTSVRFSRLE